MNIFQQVERASDFSPLTKALIHCPQFFVSVFYSNTHR